MAAKLDPACLPAAEVLRVVRERLDTLVAETGNRRLTLKARVHRARTTTKKCCAALKLIRADDPARYRRANRDLRDAARELSFVRDADVLVDSFDALLRHFGVPRQKFAADRVALRGKRHSLKPETIVVERRLRVFATQIRAVRRSLGAWAPAIDFEAVAASFSRCYRRARHALREVQARPSAATFHAWRKVAKTHYYQCRLLRAAWPEDMHARSDELKALGHALGDEHDLTGLRHQLRALALKHRLGSRTAVLALVDARRAELRAKAVPLGERLFADKPKTVAVRLRRWWQVACTQANAPRPLTT